MFYLLAECSDDLNRLIERRLQLPAATPTRDTAGESSSTSHVTLVEARELAANFTIDVIGSCAFGIQINALGDEDSAFRKAARRLSRPSYGATLWRMLRTAMPRLYRVLGVQVYDLFIIYIFVRGSIGF